MTGVQTCALPISHDILTVVQFIRTSDRPSKRLDAVAVDGAGPWLAAARAVARGAIDRAALDTGGFRFSQVRDLHSPDFLPGGAKYLDLPGMLAAESGTVWVTGETAATGSPYATAKREELVEKLLKN